MIIFISTCTFIINKITYAVEKISLATGLRGSKAPVLEVAHEIFMTELTVPDEFPEKTRFGREGGNFDQRVNAFMAGPGRSESPVTSIIDW